MAFTTNLQKPSKMLFNNHQKKTHSDLSHPTTNTQLPERSHTTMRNPRMKLKFSLSGYKSSLPLYRFQPSSPQLNMRSNSAHELLNQNTLLLSLSHLLSPRGRPQSRSLFRPKCNWTTSNLIRPSRSS